MHSTCRLIYRRRRVISFAWRTALCSVETAMCRSTPPALMYRLINASSSPVWELPSNTITPMLITAAAVVTLTTAPAATATNLWALSQEALLWPPRSCAEIQRLVLVERRWRPLGHSGHGVRYSRMWALISTMVSQNLAPPVEKLPKSRLGLLFLLYTEQKEIRNKEGIKKRSHQVVCRLLLLHLFFLFSPKNSLLIHQWICHCFSHSCMCFLRRMSCHFVVVFHRMNCTWLLIDLWMTILIRYTFI